MIFSLFQVPKNVANDTIIVELGQQWLETRAWISTFRYWLRIHFRAQSSNLLAALLSEPHNSKWLFKLFSKLQSVGIDIQSLAGLEEKSIYKYIVRRLEDIEYQTLLAHSSSSCSPHVWNISPLYKAIPPYLDTIESYAERKAFMLARLNSFPSNVLLGRFNCIPVAERLCFHGCKVPDLLPHIILVCPKFSPYRSLTTDTLFTFNSKLDETKIVNRLLNGSVPTWTSCMVVFLSNVFRINLMFSMKLQNTVLS